MAGDFVGANMESHLSVEKIVDDDASQTAVDSSGVSLSQHLRGLIPVAGEEPPIRQVVYVLTKNKHHALLERSH